MNQQRSRRFRSAQEAKEKDDARAQAVSMWECLYQASISPFFSLNISPSFLSLRKGAQ